MSVRNIVWNSSRWNPVAKVRAAGTSRRRSIDFTLEDSRNTDRFGIAETLLSRIMSKYSSVIKRMVKSSDAGKSTVTCGII